METTCRSAALRCVFTFRLYCGNSLPHDSASQLPSITNSNYISKSSMKSLQILIESSFNMTHYQSSSILHVVFWLLFVSCMLTQTNTVSNCATTTVVLLRNRSCRFWSLKQCHAGIHASWAPWWMKNGSKWIKNPTKKKLEIISPCFDLQLFCK